MPAPAFLRRWLASPPAPEPETRATGWSGDGWGAVALGSGYGGHGAIPAHMAESLGAVTACVGLISSAIASLPASLTIDGPDGPEPAPPTAPAWAVLRRPNFLQSWPAFASQMTASLLLHGNSVSHVRLDGRGALSGLMPAPWPWLLPQVIAGGDRARLVYDVIASTPEASILGLPRRLLDTDVMHVRARSDIGVIGRSVLSRAGAAVHEGLEIATLAEANWKNGLRPSAVITSPSYLTEAQRKIYKEVTLPSIMGSINTGRPAMFEGGWTYQQVSMSSVDAELLASRAFSVSDIARLFCVPEPLLQIGARSIADLSPFVTAFAQLCLSPLVTSIESEMDHSALPAGMHLRLDLDGMMRGSFSAMVAGLAALKQSGVITANDARAELDWPPIEGGDVLQPSGAPNWPADGPGSKHLGPSPGPTGTGPSEPGNHGNEGAA